jgi:hypothetical protein
MHTSVRTRAVCVLIAVVALSACQLSSANAAGLTGGKKAIAPVVATFSSFCGSSTSSGQRRLCGVGLRLSRVSHYDSFVTCSGCGAGRWGAWSKAGNSWSATGAVGSLASRARVLLVVTEPGSVGRYQLYRPVGGNLQHAGLKLSSQGCVAADVPATVIRKSFSGELRKLPTVPCVAPKVTALVFTAGLNELTTSTITHALIYGHVSKPMWLTIAQTTSGACKDDPLAFSPAQRHSRIWYVFHVKGEFEEGIRTSALLASGRYCIYLQTGAQYEKFPDGWVSQWTYNDYHSGDDVTGPVSTDLTAAGATTVALSGDAPRTETLESYDLLTPCPEISELAQYTSFGGSTMQVSGAFSETLTTATFSQSGYICSYLNDGGFTVALDSDQVSVAGTALKVQSDYAETADQVINTVSNPIGNAGTAGAGIAAGQTVSVRCILNGMGLAPFDPVWYELASAPYGDAYYVPAYAFYNNGQTSGTAGHGPLWDKAVPFCNAL